MAEIDTSIYRQPQQQNPLDTLVKTGQAADALGNIAVGDATQGAMDPRTGEIDRNKLATLLRQTTAGSMKAIPALTHLEQLRNAGFTADQAGLETFQKRMAITHHLFSGLASKDKPTMADVYDIASKALDPGLDAKKYGITMPVIMNALKQFRGPDGKPLSPDQIKQKALQIQTQAATTSEILSQHTPQMSIQDRGGNIEFVPAGTKERPATGTVIPKNLPPTTPVAGPQGGQYLGEQPAAPAATRPGGYMLPRQEELLSQPPNVTVGPRGEAPKDQGRIVPGTGRAAPAAPPAPTAPAAPVPTGPAQSLRPGFTEAAAATGVASGASAARLTESNDTAPGRRALLGNLQDLIGKFRPGIGSDWELVAKNFATRNIPMPKSWQAEGGTFDLKSVASQEEFNKLALQLAQAQFATIGGTGTDAKFSNAIATSPNELLSSMGNKQIINLLKGNEDAIQAKNSAWIKWKKANGPDTYPEFSEEFNQKYDPRTFQFRYLSRDERQKYIDAMEPDERAQFIQSLTHAHKSGWVKFETPKTK